MLHTFRKCQSPVRAGKRAFKKIVDVKEKEINTINREFKHMISRNARFIRSQDEKAVKRNAFVQSRIIEFPYV